MNDTLEPKIDTEKLQVSSKNAYTIWQWLRSRGGLFVWPSVDLARSGESWTTPKLDPQGAINGKPHWRYGNTPREITDPDEVEVTEDKEVKRFRVGIRASQGMSLKVTDGGTRRIRAAVGRAGIGAFYIFDYGTQEAVIMAPAGKAVPIAEYARQEGWTTPNDLPTSPAPPAESPESPPPP